MESSYQGVGAAAMLLPVLLLVFFVIVGWKIFTKAGKPGWAVIIPIYNVIVMLEIVNRPIWWIVLFFIPVVNVIVGIVLALDLAGAFGKGTGFAVGMILLSFIFYPILAFGDAEYQQPQR